ncbi:MAG: ATP-dependent metallopeptidase FtsH/Yme1/Tma family protein, partial [Desulfuromonadales bacterium]|nr:ATP-dependent metallopeptidase FtsH/Yme1/Tma family protein [Desulfuromonadales bacterium]
MNQFYKNLALWLVILLVMILLYDMVANKKQELKVLPYSDFVTAVSEGQVKEVVIQGPNVEGKMQDNTSFKTYAPNDLGLIPDLRAKGVTINARPEDDRGIWFTL